MFRFYLLDFALDMGVRRRNSEPGPEKRAGVIESNRHSQVYVNLMVNVHFECALKSSPC